MPKQSEVLVEARRLYVLGLAVHWLHPKSKRPIESGWTQGERKTWKYLKETYKEGFNVGVRLGSPSKIDTGYLAVIDVDVKSKDKRHRLEAVTAAQNILSGQSCPVVRSGRGNGSRHYYCLSEKPFKPYNAAVSSEKVKTFMPSVSASKSELDLLTENEIKNGIRIRSAWEISLMSEGRQVVVPPSIHPDSGEKYHWKQAIGNGTGLPYIKTTTSNRTVSKTSSGGRALNVLEDFKIEPVEMAWLPISDDIREAIVNGSNITDRSAYLLLASSALISSGLNQNEVLTVLTDPTTFLGRCSFEHAKTESRKRAAQWVHQYTFKKISRERSGEGIFETPIIKARKLTVEEQEEQSKELQEDRNWKQELKRSKEGKAYCSLKNLDLILSNKVDPNIFVADLFASRIEYGCDAPWGGKAKKYIEDIDMILVKRWLSDTEFEIEPSKDALFEATNLIAHRRGIHPVRDWLSSLRWDGINRIDTWIKDYCKGEAVEPYLSQVSRKFLVAMVKRIFEPGCQWDYVLILEGPQGKFKSSIARALASDKWFMDNLPDLKDKDSMLNLQGKWLIELGELADVKRADYSSVKAYLIRRHDTVRPHYGRLKMDVPRQSVFIGTINEGQYLKDPTGNRRYWPVKVGLCDVESLKLVRDQLFAEAMVIHQSGNEILTLDVEASAQAQEAQEDRRVEDDEFEMHQALLHFVDSEAGIKFFDARKECGFQTYDLTIGAEAPWGRWTTMKGGYAASTASHVLSKLGFEKVRRNNKRYWVKKA